jgi:CheY-like chemotaxis protein
MKILLADDEFKLRKLIATQLRKNGFEVYEASNGKDAIELAIEILPDILVMDISMPIMDGLTAYEKIKNSDKLKHLPIIILSAQNDINSLKKIKALKVQYHLFKPFRLKELFDKIEEISKNNANRGLNN